MEAKTNSPSPFIPPGVSPLPWEWEDWVPLVDGTRSRVLISGYRPVLRHSAGTWEMSEPDAAYSRFAANTLPEALGLLERLLLEQIDCGNEDCEGVEDSFCTMHGTEDCLIGDARSLLTRCREQAERGKSA